MKNKSGKIGIFLVDDHRIVREGIKMVLQAHNDMEISGQASNSREFFRLLPGSQTDVILLDIGLPGDTGIEIASRLRKEYPDKGIIILTANTSEENIFAAVRAGVMGFIPKDAGQEEVVNAVREVHAGFEYFADPVAHTVLKAYVKNAREGNDRTKVYRERYLTPRETDIIKLMFEGLSYKEIADKLNISLRTVETHKNNIMKKLELRSVIDLMKYALKKRIVHL